MVWVFVGPPGSGKDTQAQILADKLGYTVVSTGQVLREEIEAGTKIGQKVKIAYEKGELISDEDMQQLLLSRLRAINNKNYIFTGYPRTVGQVYYLGDLLTQLDLKIDGVVNFKLDDNKVVERISGRLYAPKAQKYYHEKYNPPKQPGIDDSTGEKLIRRPDDESQAVRNRLKAYHKLTAPVLEDLRQKPHFFEIDADRPIQDIAYELEKVVATTK